MPFQLGLLRASFYSGFYEVSLILDKKKLDQYRLNFSNFLTPKKRADWANRLVSFFLLQCCNTFFRVKTFLLPFFAFSFSKCVISCFYFQNMLFLRPK